MLCPAILVVPTYVGVILTKMLFPVPSLKKTVVLLICYFLDVRYLLRVLIRDWIVGSVNKQGLTQSEMITVKLHSTAQAEMI